MRPWLYSILILTLLLSACGKNEPAKTEYIESTPKVITIRESLQMAIDGEHRSDKNRARDQYRHPAATLEFFGVKPESTVVELWPGSGWYSEILGPYLRDKGTFYAASFGNVKEPEYRGRLHNSLLNKFATATEVYGKPNVTTLNPPLQTLLAPSNTADFVLTFRNVHNWTKGEVDKKVFQAAYQALKPGGVFGVVEHRAPEGRAVEDMMTSGYMTESYVIELAESVGFKLAGKSEVNANPKDTAEHEKGVWTLPPSLRLKDVDRDKYLAIGESDRMTLKFVKPAKM
ncbi:MAG: class I SAM-dependent methyltransferase [Gammaproteobacteria bacterium]|nr:methyltransferase [Gammaproteobacteria bacterium]NNC97079.1 class I SAM-dependent methyltransferase [Gammaproteobacteria bacterium]NNM14066.1 class I SAM-dependent methyltransferase [Gammaproteobacteria bacterium]